MAAAVPLNFLISPRFYGAFIFMDYGYYSFNLFYSADNSRFALITGWTVQHLGLFDRVNSVYSIKLQIQACFLQNQ